MQPGPVTVDPYLQRELRPGEQLLWWGRPDPRRRAKTNNVNTSYITYGVTSLFWILLIIFNVYQLTNDPFGTNSIAVVLLIAAVLLLGLNLYRIYLLYTRSQKSNSNLSGTIYGITNQRIIVMTATGQSFAVKSNMQNDIGQISRIETGEGWGDVTYGVPRSMQSGTRTVIAADKLAGIPNARMVEDILIRTFKSSGPQQPWYAQPPSAPSQPYPPPPQQYQRPEGNP